MVTMRRDGSACDRPNSRSSSRVAATTLATTSGLNCVRVRVQRAGAHTAGWALPPLTDDAARAAPPHTRIRGFALDKTAERALIFDAPGDYVVDDAA